MTIDLSHLRGLLEKATLCKKPSDPDVPENWRMSIYDNPDLADAALQALPEILSLLEAATEPMRAIDFALSHTCEDAAGFLRDWSEGCLHEWPEFEPPKHPSDPSPLTTKDTHPNG